MIVGPDALQEGGKARPTRVEIRVEFVEHQSLVAGTPGSQEEPCQDEEWDEGIDSTQGWCCGDVGGGGSGLVAQVGTLPRYWPLWLLGIYKVK